MTNRNAHTVLTLSLLPLRPPRNSSISSRTAPTRRRATCFTPKWCAWWAWCRRARASCCYTTWACTVPFRLLWRSWWRGVGVFRELFFKCILFPYLLLSWVFFSSPSFLLWFLFIFFIPFSSFPNSWRIKDEIAALPLPLAAEPALSATALPSAADVRAMLRHVLRAKRKIEEWVGVQSTLLGFYF